MTAIFISLAVGVLTFCFGMLGHCLHRLLPERHMSMGSKEMIGGIIGLVSLLLALVLGTLVGSAYGFCAALDSHNGNEPFQRLAPTPRALFSFSP